MARPRKTDEEKTVMIGLEKQDVDILDACIRHEMRIDTFMEGYLTGTSNPTTREVAKAKRLLLGKIIREKLAHPLQPDRITISVPTCIYFKYILPVKDWTISYPEIKNWLRSENTRLNNEAPKPLQMIMKASNSMREMHVMKLEQEDEAP